MGTYVAVNMKSINDENKLIVHKQAKSIDDLLDDSSKKITKRVKNKIVLEVKFHLNEKKGFTYIDNTVVHYDRFNNQIKFDYFPE